MNDNDRVLISVDNGVGMLRLNRPAVLNALDPILMTMLADQMEAWETDDSVRCILITGSDKAFAAGADIGDMAERSSVEMEERNQFATWDRIDRIRKPIVAAVNGFALGGGCELVMMCDIVIAGDTAQFGQPEIKLGVIPGAGGTQRLTRAVGKALAMDLVSDRPIHGRGGSTPGRSCQPGGRRRRVRNHRDQGGGENRRVRRRCSSGGKRSSQDCIRKQPRRRCQTRTQTVSTCSLRRTIKRKACRPSPKNASRHSLTDEYDANPSRGAHHGRRHSS